MRLFRAGDLAHASVGNNALTRMFPEPYLLVPPTAGVDISDASIKWLSLTPFKEGLKVQHFGNSGIDAGIVVNGVVKQPDRLIEALKSAHAAHPDLSHAHAALPEEAGYVFTMLVPRGGDRASIMNIIEFEMEGRVPLQPAQAVYDFEVVSDRPETAQIEIAVIVFPKEVADSYADVFFRAGIKLLSLEMEPRSIARAIMTQAMQKETVLLVDFGLSRSGIAILKNGVPIFTSTVEVGGETVTKTLVERLGISEAEATTFKNEQGIYSANQKGAEVMTGAVAALADEVARIVRYWDTRRAEYGDSFGPISRIVLAGGSSNMKGIAGYIAGRVQTETGRAELWQNICSFNQYIPPIDRHSSLSYATAIGLALRSFI